MYSILQTFHREESSHYTPNHIVTDMEVTERQEMTSFQRLSKYDYKAGFSIASHNQLILYYINSLICLLVLTNDNNTQVIHTYYIMFINRFRLSSSIKRSRTHQDSFHYCEIHLPELFSFRVFYYAFLLIVLRY